MRTNLFNVREINDDEIIIEEEQTKNPIILFFLKYGKIIYFALMFLSVSSFMVGVSMTISNLSSSSTPSESKPGVTLSIDGGSDVDTAAGGVMTPITDEYAKKLFGGNTDNSQSNKGVILEVSQSSFDGGKITFYSDKSALIEYDDGRYERVFPVDGDYGVSSQGVKKEGAVVREVTGEVKQLGDATVLYFSDGSAEVTKDGLTIFVRDSNDIDDNGNVFNETISSGVSYVEDSQNKNGTLVKRYTNGTIEVTKDGVKYVVRHDEDINIDGNGNVTFPNNNASKVLEEKKLNDGTIIVFYDDGSADIVKNEKSLSVRKGGHIVYDDNGITEIIEQERAYQRHTKKLPNNGEVDVFDDGSAVVTDPDGTKHYVEDSSDLKYDEDGNIKDVTSTQSNVVDEKTLPDGKKVTDFDNGKSLVEDPKTGDKYVTDTDDIEYDDNGNIKDDPQSNPSSGNDDKLPDPKDIVVSNDTGSKIAYRLVIEETDNYNKYNTKRLIPDYVRYILKVNNQISNPTKLNANMWKAGSQLEGGLMVNKNTYILREGTLENGETLKISLGIWASYEDITNEYQNSAFIGTIKLYADSIE